MKRYLVFLFDSYYPDGGWGDFADSFDDLNESISFARDRRKPSSGDYQYDYYQVVDRDTGTKLDL